MVTMQQWSRVSDPVVIQTLSTFIDEAILDDESDLATDWLRKRGWLAFPLYGSGFVWSEGIPEGRYLAEGLAQLGCTRVLAANVDLPATDSAFGFEAAATVEGLTALCSELGFNRYILTDSTGSFLIYYTEADVHIVAGPPSFVIQVMGGDLEAAKAEFISEAATAVGGMDENRLLDVLDRYEDYLAASGFGLKTPKKARRKTMWYISIHPKGEDREIDILVTYFNFPLYAAQCALGRDRHDPLTDKIRLQPEHFKLAWAPSHPYDFEKFDYYLMAFEP